MKFTTNACDASLKVNDSLYYLPASVYVKRSKADLPVKLFYSEGEKDFVLKASNSPVYVYGNLIWEEFMPFAYLIDLATTKRFYYGSSVFLNVHDTTHVLKTRMAKQYDHFFTRPYPLSHGRVGQINIYFSLPLLNQIYLHPQDETTKANIGMFGLSGGLEYYYRKNKFLELGMSLVSGTHLHLGEHFQASYPNDSLKYHIGLSEDESNSSLYFSLTDNFRFTRFTLGYGLNYSENLWDVSYQRIYANDTVTPIKASVDKYSMTWGITLNGYYQWGKHFFIGLIYRPTLLTTVPVFEFKYEHLISLDLKWVFRVKR
jgi:hypothetical protein